MSATTTARSRVLGLSTVAFTLMFAVWLMFGILGKPIQDEFGLTEVELSWVVAVAALNGSLWRLPTGMRHRPHRWPQGADGPTARVRRSGLPGLARRVLPDAARPSLPRRLRRQRLLRGHRLELGVAAREHQGFALGLFGAGNVGASVTKFIGPPLIAGTAGATYFGFVDGGWRLVPVVYAVLLVAMAALLWFGTPSEDRAPGTGQPLREQVRPLRQMRVWRFSLYYVAVFGAYVALAAWLPTYYMDNFDVSLQTAALLTATYIFPASLLRPFGGSLSDRFGARRVIYWTFAAMLVTTGLLMMPNGHIVISHPDGSQTEHLAYILGLVPFAVLVFLLGCAMGVGKAAVFKHIPEYFPAQRRRGRRPGRDARRAGRLRPAAAVRLHQVLVRIPVQHLLRPVRAHRGLRRCGCTGPSSTCCTTESPELRRRTWRARYRRDPCPLPSARGGTGMSTTPTQTRSGGEWLESWDPENEETWDKPLAWRTLWVTTFALFLAFVAWFLPSALIPKLNPLGYSFSTNQLYWMAAMPGLSAGLFRLVWMVLPPCMGTRKMVTLTSLLLIFSDARLGGARPGTDGALLGADGAGLPGRHRRWRVLRVHAQHLLLLPQVQAGHGPRPPGRARQLRRLSGAAAHALPHRLLVRLRSSAATQSIAMPGAAAQEVWYQNAAFIWIPLMVLVVGRSPGRCSSPCRSRPTSASSSTSSATRTPG